MRDVRLLEELERHGDRWWTAGDVARRTNGTWDGRVTAGGLIRLCRLGLADRNWDAGRWQREYRITGAGKAWLAKERADHPMLVVVDRAVPPLRVRPGQVWSSRASEISFGQLAISDQSS